MAKRDKPAGLVVLVGAGPGDPTLATAAAIDWLSKADTVFYDRLAGRALLRNCRADAELIYVGKSPGGRRTPQQQINELLVARGRSGQLVVRLKGGDPFIFGRGGEEAEALAAAGVPFRVVPGVTAAAAAGALAGIPLTDRRCASTIAFITARQDPARSGAGVDWQALAKADTIVLYMGVGDLAETVGRILDAGRPPRTPAAIIQAASTPAQRIVTAPLCELPATAEAARIRPPAITIIGEVVALREKLAWFEHLPLFGRTVLVTRPAGQAGRLTDGLARLGAGVIEAPTIDILPPGDFAAVDSALGRLGEFDLVVFTSVNGVEAFISRCAELDLDARALGAAGIAAIGPATAGALKRHFLRADIVPAGFTTESLAEAIRSAGAAVGKGVLLARADIAGPALSEALRVDGAEVEEVAIYRTACPASLPKDAADALGDGHVDWITFASSSAARNFIALAGDPPSGARLAAIGPVTAATLRSCGLTVAAVAEPHTIDGLIQAIVECESP